MTSDRTDGRNVWRAIFAAIALAGVGAAVVYLARVDGAAAQESEKQFVKAPETEFLPPPSKSEERILAAMEEPTVFDFVETPLRDVINFLEDKHQIPIQIDEKALEDFGVGTDTPVTCHIKDVKLASALRLWLRDLDLAYSVKNEVLVITTKDVGETDVFARTYPVADLVGDNDFDSLIEVITTTVDPQTWDEVGGPGSISPVTSARCLVVSQTRDVHDEILQLLRALRRARQIAIESGETLEPKATKPQTTATGMGGVGGGVGGTGAKKGTGEKDGKGGGQF